LPIGCETVVAWLEEINERKRVKPQPGLGLHRFA
jgi:hypothetical protein